MRRRSRPRRSRPAPSRHVVAAASSRCVERVKLATLGRLCAASIARRPRVGRGEIEDGVGRPRRSSTRLSASAIHVAAIAQHRLQQRQRAAAQPRVGERRRSGIGRPSPSAAPAREPQHVRASPTGIRPASSRRLPAERVVGDRRTAAAAARPRRARRRTAGCHAPVPAEPGIHACSVTSSGPPGSARRPALTPPQLAQHEERRLRARGSTSGRAARGGGRRASRRRGRSARARAGRA